MNETYIVEIVDTNRVLNKNEQVFFRDRLKQLLEKEEIISICLDDKNLFLEYNQNKIDKASIKDLLLEYDFLVGEILIEATNEIHVT
jgi:hypothetical protein